MDIIEGSVANISIVGYGAGFDTQEPSIEFPPAPPLEPDIGADLLNYQYRYRGMVWGAYTNFGIIEDEGLDSISVNSGSSSFARNHGNIPGKHYHGERIIVQTLSVDTPDIDLADIEQEILRFKSHMFVREDLNPNLDILEAKLPGRPQVMVRARPIDYPLKRSASPGPHIIRFNITFEAAEPRVRSIVREEVTLPPYNPQEGGLDFPIDFPVEFASGGQVGTSRVATNGGNSFAHPMLRVWGPSSGAATRFILQNTTNGDELDIETDVVSNQILTADMEAMIVPERKLPVELDGSTRYKDWKLPRKPFRLSPGDNVVRLIIEGSVVGLQAKLFWNHTWI